MRPFHRALRPLFHGRGWQCLVSSGTDANRPEPGNIGNQAVFCACRPFYSRCCRSARIGGDRPGHRIASSYDLGSPMSLVPAPRAELPEPPQRCGRRCWAHRTDEPGHTTSDPGWRHYRAGAEPEAEAIMLTAGFITRFGAIGRAKRRVQRRFGRPATARRPAPDPRAMLSDDLWRRLMSELPTPRARYMVLSAAMPDRPLCGSWRGPRSSELRTVVAAWPQPSAETALGLTRAGPPRDVSAI